MLVKPPTHLEGLFAERKVPPATVNFFH